MRRLISIFENNRSTFYRFADGEPNKLVFSYTMKILFTSLITIVVASGVKSLIPTVLTAQSVLVGFGFSLMFFLLSNPINRDVSSVSLEKQVNVEKLLILSKEIFYNVAYFNLVTTISIIFCLGYLVLDIVSIEFQTYLDVAIKVDDNIFYYMKYAFVFIVVLTVIEGFHTFMRTLMRVDYYFSKRIELDS